MTAHSAAGRRSALSGLSALDLRQQFQNGTLAGYPDSEIFNQLVRTIAWGRSHRCIMRNNRDGAPERFLVLAAAGFALLCCGLIAVAFS
jgi:hypothetical protein